MSTLEEKVMSYERELGALNAKFDYMRNDQNKIESNLSTLVDKMETRFTNIATESRRHTDESIKDVKVEVTKAAEESKSQNKAILEKLEKMTADDLEKDGFFKGMIKSGQWVWAVVVVAVSIALKFIH